MGNDSLDALAVRIEALEKQVSEIFDRLNDREIGPSVLATKLNQTLVTLGEIKQAVSDLKGKPGRLWDAFITAAISAVIASVVGLAMARFK